MGFCHLENTIKKLPLGKNPLGNYKQTTNLRKRYNWRECGWAHFFTI